MAEDVETRDIGLSGIAVLPSRLRSLRPEVVEALAKSMATQGLLQPIVLRPAESTGYYLVAGQHRYEAARKLKWESIPSRILHSLAVDDALLSEIDENLIRADLSPAERAAHIAARKAVYERINPETAHGAVGRGRKKSRQLGDSNERFTKATSDATGHSERSIQRDANRGTSISQQALAMLARTSLDKGDELDALAKLSDAARGDLIQRAVNGEKVSAKAELKKEQRSGKERVLAGLQCALPDKKYGVIYADPEWRFEVYSRDTGMDRSADNHYPTSGTDAICARPVKDIAADDCALFLWATVPMLPDALKVMAAWGFEYKSNCVWVKDRIGTGYWFRNQHELLLVGARGKIPAPAMGTQWASAFEANVGKHSEKPEIFYRLIEEYFPNLPKIELNARRARAGWDSWGLEAPTDAAGAEVPHDESGEVIDPVSADVPVASPRDLEMVSGEHLE